LNVSHLIDFIECYSPYTDYQCVNLGIQRKENEINQYWDEYIAKAKECGYKLMAWNVWDKTMCGSIGQQKAFIPIRHEWIFVFGRNYFDINTTWEKLETSIGKAKQRGVRQPDGSFAFSSTGDRSNKLKKMESVLCLCSETGAIRGLHPATFPVGLPSEYIKAMTNENESVIEPFGGSGSTLIACEQLNRNCYICELDEHYCDVIIERWENFTGEKAIKLEGDE
jgi:DNA modification methylase